MGLEADEMSGIEGQIAICSRRDKHSHHRYRLNPFPNARRTPDQQDAFATAEWLRRADRDGSLEKFLFPDLEPHERKTAEIEGWILGVA
jgi:hypothetical protein